MARDKKIRMPLFESRTCKQCGTDLEPRYAHQQIHPHCRTIWRRVYQKKYQRRVRLELKSMAPLGIE